MNIQMLDMQIYIENLVVLRARKLEREPEALTIRLIFLDFISARSPLTIRTLRQLHVTRKEPEPLFVLNMQ